MSLSACSACVVGRGGLLACPPNRKPTSCFFDHRAPAVNRHPVVKYFSQLCSAFGGLHYMYSNLQQQLTIMRECQL